ncbi:hypothetical protein H6F75_09010 [Nodosilinea sp. FACHB-131]|uniref:hypothetical protein n=1 Tax=Cyanophyceae TaxID=3028117 RepID=UPI0016839138|nr:hypothetical protein [Nodosilinea sp. FACHB-131]MBD1873621.1 hypothetical protein [Nodosilinea sp. FACHB-131]
MSNAPGPAIARSFTQPDSQRSDCSGSKKTPDLGTASLSDDPWVKALFGFSQAVADRPRSGQRKACGTSETGTGSKRVSVPELSRSQPDLTVGGAIAAPYSLADLAPQLANPLAPLRDRDRQALTEIFDHEHMGAVEVDILTRLSYLVPEPPWDIEPYEFLQEFL